MIVRFKRFIKNTMPNASASAIAFVSRALSCKLEYSFFASSMLEAIERDDLESRYSRLIDGLDEESVRTVDRILERLRILKRNHGLPVGLYNSSEKEDSRYLIKNFANNIKQISEDCYAFKQYKLPISHFESCVFMSFHGLPEIDTDPDLLKAKDIIDAGGFIGDSVLVLAPYTERKVYTFEPVKKNFDLLLKTMELNHIQNVVCENVALGSQRGELSFQIAGSSSGKSWGGGGGGGKAPFFTVV